MDSLSLDEYIDVIVKSGLMSDGEVRSVLGAISDGEAVIDPQSFAEHLEHKGLLTSWQNEKLLNKKYKGFFLGNYKFLGKIGAGGMGRVYLAEHTALQRPAAIKILSRSLMKNTSHLDRFRLEARALAQLDHKNIVRV